MSSISVAVISLLALLVSYFTYGRFIGQKILKIGELDKTPAHSLRDEMDFVPTNKHVLFGHHFASIAGAGPIVGPAIAVIYGWGPALLWVILGAIFIGATHDFSAVTLSVRHQGRSIGAIMGQYIGPRAGRTFLLLIYFLLSLVLAVFAIVIAILFGLYIESIIPIAAITIIAPILGLVVYKTRGGLLGPSIIAFILSIIALWYGAAYPLGFTLSQNTWIALLLIYAFIASVLPVWILLQPRDYINSFLLYLGLALTLLGLFFANMPMAAPFVRVSPPGAPPIIPFLFILIACGAISGFHNLISSGTTSKQVDKEKDMKYVGYGGMLLEGVLAVVVILACCAGLGSSAQWASHYQSWATAGVGLQPKLSAFCQGGANFLAAMGIPTQIGTVFISVMIVSFAMTTLDSATRINRLIISEFGKNLNIDSLQNKYVASGVAVLTAGALAMIHFGQTPTGMLLWPIFGISNQILAVLGFSVLALYLAKRNTTILPAIIPMALMVVITVWAMGYSLIDYLSQGNWLLLLVGGLILLIEVILLLEAAFAYNRYRS